MKKFYLNSITGKTGVLILALIFAAILPSHAQVYTTISSGTNVYNSGATVTIPSGFFINDGTYTDTTSPGTMNLDGGVTVSGAGTTTVYHLNFTTSGSSVLNSLVSVYNMAAINSGTTVDAGSGNLYIRSDIKPSTANLVVNGVLTGSVQGIIAFATATSGCGASYSSTLSTNISGSVVLYQWQSSPDSSAWSNVSGATNATYAATVSSTIYYRLTTSTTNSSFTNTTPGIKLNGPASVTPTFIVAPGSITCAGTSVTYTTQSGETSYSWSVPGTGGVDYTIISGGISSTDNTVTLTWTTTGTKTVTVNYTTGSGCTGSTPASNTTSVNPLPTVSAITGNTTLSTAITTTLSDATASGVWASGTTSVATVGSSTGVVSGVSAGSALISYTVTTAGCSTTVTTNVTVKTPTNGLAFNGTNNYVNVGTLHLVSAGSGQFTAEGWVYMRANNPSTSFLFGDERNVNGGLQIAISASGAIQTFQPSSGIVVSGYTVPLNTWTHIAFVQDASNLKLYVNGNFIQNLLSSPNLIIETNQQSYFGAFTADFSTFTRESNAVMDEFRFWKVARTQTQIQNNMNCDVAQDPNLLAYYRFDQGTAGGTNSGLTCAYDYSSNGYSGTLINFSLTGTSSNYVTGAVGNCNTVTPIAPGSFSGNTPVCVGSTITLSNANTGGTWSTASGNVTVNSTSGLVTGVSAGTATVNYTLNCSTSSVTVTINALPVVSAITGNTTLSTAITTTLSDATSGGVWTTGTTSVATVGSSSGVVSGVSAGTALISYTVTTSGCSTTVTTNVTVKTPTNGLSFDGVDDYVSLPAGLTSSMSSFTFEAWVYATSNSFWSRIFDFGANTTKYMFLSPSQGSTGIPRFAISTSGSGGEQTLDATSAVTLNAWTHFAVTIDGSTNTGKLYINDTLIATNTGMTLNPASLGSLANDWLGRSQFAGNGFLSATLDEVRIYNVARTQTQILSDMNCDVPQNANLIAYYRFDQGTAGGSNTGLTCVNDYSGNNNSGTLNNFALSGSTSNYITGATGNCNTITLPTPGAISGNTPVCVGSSITLTDATTGGLWSTGSSNVTVNSTSGLVTGVSAGTAAVSYTLNCVSASVTATVNARPTPSFTSAPGATTCAGTSVTYTTQSGQSNYTWSVPGTLGTDYSITSGGIGTSSNTVTLNWLTAGSKTVTVNYTNSNGCTGASAATNTTTVNPVPVVSGLTVSGSTVCAGNASTATIASSLANGTYTINYTLGAPNAGSYSATSVTTTGGAGSFSTPALANAGSTSITINSVVNNATSCSSISTASNNITVNANPVTAGLTVSGSTICAGVASTITIGGSLANGTYNINYTLGAPNAGTYTASVTTTGGAGTFSTPTLSSAGSTSVTINSVTNASTSCSSTSTATNSFTVNPALVVSGLSITGTTVCAGSSSTVTVSSSLANDPYTFNYTLSGSNSGTFNSSSTTITGGAGSFSTVGLAGVGTTSITINSVTDNNTSCTASVTASTTVTVNPNPITAGLTVSGTTVCSGTGIANASTVTIHSSLVDNSYIINYTLGAPNAGSYNASVTTTGGTATFLTPALANAGTTSITINSVAYATTLCASASGATNNITVRQTPIRYAVTGGGTECAGLPGFPIGLAGSDLGVLYTLYANGVVFGTPIFGTGSALSFGTFATSDTFMITARNYSYGCPDTMTGTAIVVINPLPAVTTMTGGGSYCVGGSGVNVGLAGSAIGIDYQLYLGGTPVGGPVAGVGTAFNFGLQTTAGTYTATATNPATGCTSNMSGSKTVSINPLPNIYTVTGGGSYCSGGTGVTVGLSGSDAGVSYQLYRGGSPVAGMTVNGTGSAISFGLQTVAGTYTVVANNITTSCTNNMTGSATISVTALPTVYSVTGGGSYCIGGTGVAVGLSNSDAGVNYQLYNGITAVGSPVAGTGSAISFGLQTTTGTYTVAATDATAGCRSNMSGSATISTTPLPATYTVTGGGGYCSGGTGVAVGLGGSQGGINYQLYNGASTVGTPVAGTGAALNFGLQTATGTYTVVATNATTGCVNNMTGSATVSINPLPTVYAVSGGGSYCSGSTGVTVGMANSQTGVNYQLYNGASGVGSAVAGTGAALTFGIFTTAGTYTVIATNATTHCVSNMSGSATISINPLPAVYSMTGGGGYCAGGTGVNVGLSNSVTGVNYQLYRGSTSIGSPVAGTGSALSFGLQTTAGTYTAVATDATTGCTSNMSGSATVTVNPLPTVFTMTGGGSYCSGGTGVLVGLSGSQTGVSYQLYNGASTVGSAVAGTGIALTFGLQTATGTYTVVATNGSTTCTSNMTGSATVSVNANPTVYSVTGGGSYCSGGTGVAVGLSGSDAGVNYQLYNGASTVGSAVAGTGSAISFGMLTAASTYTVSAVNATTGCRANMTGSASITINPLPAAIPVTGGGTFCAGGSGVAIGLSGSSAGINYQLFRGATTVGTTVAGTGSAISFGIQTITGTYTVTGTNATTGCTNNMSGSATVSNYAPLTVYTITGGGGYCTGSAGVAVGLSGSTSGIYYQLYRGSTAVGGPIVGTGAAISFGLQTVAGTYTVVATNPGTSCTGNMAGSTTITVNPLPSAYSITGGGTTCAGTGVAVGLSNSALGVNYQLYNGSTAVGSPVAGTGSAISFGLQTSAGTYSAVAIDATTGCTANMTGSAIVVVNPVPTAYIVTGGGAYCSGSGLHVYLSGSSTGISYQLYNGSTPMGSAVAGTGAALDMGLQTTAGTYTVVAINTTTGCTANMTGSATITVGTLPTAYTVTGGGSYCTGGSGLAVGLSGSDAGVSYQLYNGSTATGSPVTGTGGAISFGLQTAAGTYTVVATSAGACTNNMTGSATITVNTSPTVYAVTGGGGYCIGGSGVHVGLSGSDAGVNYQLYLGSTASGSPLAGTGAALDFGLKTAAGTYTVVATNATTGCVNNMTGSAIVTIGTIPAVYTVTGGGVYCAGGAGVAVGLSGSQTGVSYQLYNGSTATGSPVAGTGAAISFGSQTAAGTYTVVASNTGSCTNNMTGSATVTINPAPTDYAFTGGSAYCSGGTGVTIGLAGSDVGTNYQLYRYTTTLGTVTVGSPVAGTGSAISFGTQTLAGLYTVIATNTTTGCTRTLSGSTNLIVHPLPAIIVVSGGGSYCPGGSGVAVTMPGSAVGVNYQLYLGGTPVGTPVAGIGTGFSFGLQTTPGTYTVIATDTATGCSSNMGGSVSVAIYPTVAVYSMTGGGSYCSGGTGVTVGLSGSASGVNYQLYRGGLPVAGAVVAGTGAAISFAAQTIAGTYTAVATNAVTGCTANMTGSATVSINALPTVYPVTGGGSYCTGGTGVSISLSNSDAGVNYQLYRGTTVVGSPVAGTGSAISFGSSFTTAGTYTVTATNATTGCTSNMTGSATVSISASPAVFTVSGGGSYCAGGTTGVHVLLSGSTGLTSYQLYLGSTPVGSPVAGTGASIDFGAFTTVGTYTVSATSTTTGCTNNMSGSATISTIALPTVFTVTGGGSYCSGGPGVHVGLSSSATGVNYQLYRGSTAVGAAVAGTGAALDFGLQTVAGTYTVVATNAGTSCTSNMTGSATISVNALPTVYSMTGGGSYCTGSSGVNVGLSGSDTGVNYQLFMGSTAIGSAVAGTGSAISFGLQTTAGSYTVTATNATTGCVKNMTGTATVSINPLPAVYSVTGGGSYCSGGTGVTVGLSGSQSGVNYQLYNGSTVAGSPRSGTGAAISFGVLTTAATYTVTATNATTGCTSNMTGSATVSVNPLPIIDTVTGGGAYCTGGTGVHIGLNTSTTGVNYQLYFSTSVSGSVVAGTGSALDFGLRTTAGTYTVKATNATTGCISNMAGSASVSVNPLPTVVSMTGGGSYCSGGTGVTVGLNASVGGTNYQLYLGGSPAGSPVAGVGGALSFGLQTSAGTYTATATNAITGCTSNMSGSVTVVVNPLPSVYTVTGGGSYCSGGTGVHVGLSGSNTGISYSLYRSASPTGATLSGTGAAIDFGLESIAGTYTVVAKNPSTSCISNMTGSATVAVMTLPTVAAISGPTTVHDGATITLTNATTGGSWSSSNTAILTVGSATGVVTGVSTGFANISYTVTNTCGSGSAYLNIHELGPVPPSMAAITSGNTSICVGTTTTLTNSVSGGTWSSSNSEVASINPQSGEVKGVTAGIAAITYTFNTSAGTSQVFTPIVVNATPDAANIAAPAGTAIAKGQKLKLTASVANGAAVKAYQWLLNKEAVTGATSATFTSANLANNDEVTCVINGECGNPVSASVVVTVNTEAVSQVQTASGNITIAPNPNRGNFVIKGSTGLATDEELTLTITDVLGQVVYSNTIVAKGGQVNQTVQLGNTPNGMYLLTVHSATENKVFHIVVEQ